MQPPPAQQALSRVTGFRAAPSTGYPATDAGITVRTASMKRRSFAG